MYHLKTNHSNNKSIIQDKFIKEQKIFIYVLIFYTFLYSNVVRLLLSNLTHINLLYSYLPTILITGYCLYYFNRENGFILYVAFFIFLLDLISVGYYQIDIKKSYRFLYSILVPLLLISLNLERPKAIIKQFLAFYNILIIVNVIYGLVDFLTGKKIQTVLANLLYGTNYYVSIQWDMQSQVYRLFSLLGHPLTNMLLLIIFISMNLAYTHYYNEKTNVPLNIVFLITIIGTVVCNSKFGIGIISAILISIIIVKKKKLRNLLLLLIICLSVLGIGPVKQNIVQRFLMASENGDLTNGRMSAMDYLSNSDVPFPNVFIGKGMGTSDSLLQSVSSLNNIELPTVMYMYDYGIFITFLIYLILYLYPIIIFFKNRHFYLAFLFTLIFIFANSYNGMAVSLGITQILTFITMLLINMSNDIKMK